jgi:transposase
MDTGENSEILTSTASGVEEEVMIDQTQWGAVRVLFERGVPKKEIARQLDLDVKTVRKWLKSSWVPQHRAKRGSALDRWRDLLQARAPEVGFNAVVLLRELQALGYQGAYTTLVDYIRPWRTLAAEALPTPRFETDPGKQAQVDWGSLGVWFGSDKVRLHVFTMVLGFSRRLFAKGYHHERIGNLLDGHAAAFAHFGGRTEQVLYDNPRTIVLEKNESTGEVVWNKTFKDRMDFYGVDPRLCRYYRAQTKGKVENGVKYVKGNALAGRCFQNLDELNEYLLDWCVRVADERIHGTTHERPSARFDRAEASALVPVDVRPAPPHERVVTRIVPPDTYVTVETNRYPVPVDWIGDRVEVRVAGGQIVIHGAAGASVQYAKLDGKHQIAGWAGAPRTFGRAQEVGPLERPRWDPVYGEHLGQVEVRPLSEYAALVEEVMP